MEQKTPKKNAQNGILERAEILRDKDGIIREVLHFPGANFSIGSTDDEATLAAYFRAMQPHWKLPESRADAPALKNGSFPLQLSHIKSLPNCRTAVLEQYQGGIPVWEGGMAIVLAGSPGEVSLSSNHFRYDIGVVGTPKPSKSELKLKSVKALQSFLRQLPKDGPSHARHLADLAVTAVTETRRLIYRFEMDKRLHPEQRKPDGKHGIIGASEQVIFPGTAVHMPKVPDSMVEAKYYVVTEVLFTAFLTKPEQAQHLRMMIEPDTGAILYLHLLSAHLNCHVFKSDPITTNGPLPAAPASPAAPAARIAALNSAKSLVQLPPTLPPWKSSFVELDDLSNPPTIFPSTNTSILASVHTDDFTCANAYYHCDRAFRMLQNDYGLPLSYLVGTVNRNGSMVPRTVFPVKVDPRADEAFGGNAKNARAEANYWGTGVAKFLFGSWDDVGTIGVATDWRVVLHEFGHALLYAHVHSANFAFCHSPGDALAAILNDPGSLAPDLHETYPWTKFLRRHDRKVENGWAFKGSQDSLYDGYTTEQILSTTLFQFYRLSGGDLLGYRGVQEHAAKWVVKLLLHAIGTLTPATNPQNAEALYIRIKNADLTINSFQGVPGRRHHKILRWCFERQGAFQLSGTPLPIEAVGQPPAVDVYINDGRAGGYAPIQPVFWEAPAIWNRRLQDSGLAHESPDAGKNNYLYVRVANRGGTIANGATLTVFVLTSPGQSKWPYGFTSLTSLPINIPSIADGGHCLCGPIKWTPTHNDQEFFLAIVNHPSDPPITQGLPVGSLELLYLVPFDNNIAVRHMPVIQATSRLAAATSLSGRTVAVHNSFDTAMPLTIQIEQDPMLATWQLELMVVGYKANMLMPVGGTREFTLQVNVNNPSQQHEPLPPGSQPKIRVMTYLGEQLVGGVTFVLAPQVA